MIAGGDAGRVGQFGYLSDCALLEPGSTILTSYKLKEGNIKVDHGRQ
jgi:hypothetical protein